MKRLFYKKEGGPPPPHFINGAGVPADVTPPPFHKDLVVWSGSADPTRSAPH